MLLQWNDDLLRLFCYIIGDFMTQTTICVRIDADLKKDFEIFCNSIGVNMSTAINMFVKKTVSEQRIPFELSAGHTRK